jgi:hypothetical protein
MANLSASALLGLLITASLLVITTDWRLSFLALATQYLLAALLLAQIVIWQVVGVKVIVGLLVIAIFVVTGGQVNFGRSLVTGDGQNAPQARFEFPTNAPFRVLACAMIIVVAWVIGNRADFALPGLPFGLNIASYLLLALGLLNLGLTEEPMNAGMGLLTVLTGFEILYAGVEQSLAVMGLLAAVNFAVAMAVSYLAFLRYSAENLAEPED